MYVHLLVNVYYTLLIINFFYRSPSWFAQQLKATQPPFQQFSKSLQRITPTTQQKTLFFVVPRECSTPKICVKKFRSFL